MPAITLATSIQQYISDTTERKREPDGPDF